MWLNLISEILKACTTYCIVCSPPQVKSPLIFILVPAPSPPSSLTPSPLLLTMLLAVYEFAPFFAQSLRLCHPAPKPPPLWQLSVCSLCLSLFLFVCYFLLFARLAVQNLFSLMSSHFLFFLLYPFPEEIYQKNILLWEMSQILLPMFSSRIFVVSSLTFKSLIHFEFILVHSVGKWSSFFLPFFFFACISPIFQHHLLNKLSLSPCMFLPPSSNINRP